MSSLLHNSPASHHCIRQPGDDRLIKCGARAPGAHAATAPDDRADGSDDRDRGDFPMAPCCQAEKRFAPRGARSRGGGMMNASQ